MKHRIHLVFCLLMLPALAVAGGARMATAMPSTRSDAADSSCLAIPSGFSMPKVKGRTAPASLWQGWHYDHANLTVTPDVALIDQRLAIRVHGLTPGEPVTLVARTTGALGVRWRSSATFTADRHGVVDVARAAPIYGDYAGAHAMGLIWSMLPQKVDNPTYTPFYMPSAGATLKLAALANGRTLATATVLRRSRGQHVKERKLDSDGLVGNLFLPAGSGPHPAVIVIGGSEGGLKPQTAQAALLATHGYVALALAYFQSPYFKNSRTAKLPRELVRIPLEYFRQAAQWLVQQPGVAGKRVGIMGWSKGAEAALLLASTWPKTFDAVVAYAPSADVWSGLHRGPGPLHSSWTLHGKPVPFVSYEPQPDIYNQQKHTLYLAHGYLKPIKEGKAGGKAAIPVERIAGPVLLISGTDDAIWPSSRFAAQIMTRLREHHHRYPDASLCYRGAGHFVVYWPWRPTLTTGLMAGPVKFMFGGNQLAYAHAEMDSWPKVLAFLKHALKQEPSRHE